MNRSGVTLPRDDHSSDVDWAEDAGQSLRRRPSQAWTWAFDLIFLIGAITAIHLGTSGPIPAGGDGGNWLALARELLGQHVMSAEVTYEPVFIGLLALLLSVLGPISGLLLSALVAEALLIAGVYTVTRSAGRIPALASVALVAMAGYRLEAYAWGAYPQILALGFGLVTTWVLAQYVDKGRLWRLAIVIAGTVMVLTSHKLVGGLMLMAVPAAAVHMLWLARWSRSQWRRAALAVGGVWVAGSVFVVTWFLGTEQGVEPTLNAMGLSRAEHIRAVFLEAPIPWIVVGALALIGMGTRSWHGDAAPTISLGFGWVVASVVGLLLLAEPRALLQAQVAGLPIAVVVVWRWAGRSLLSGPRRMRAVGLGIAAAATFGSLALTGMHRYDTAADWYRVVGQREREALTTLAARAEPGDLVVASRGPNGNPIGWWVEGFAGVPTFTSIDQGFLAFPDERAQAETAEALFTSPSEGAASLLDEIGARFLILDRRGPDVAWLAGGDPTGLEPISDGTLLILEVSDG